MGCVNRLINDEAEGRVVNFHYDWGRRPKL